eukprot:TRINITY_DN23778_c0_g1_i1.p1 TRINITY_DN23778_c0_g1~~TRINITY_DN23778_c0_g1_i1.p1  ORF type:complete len:163 (+),score=37.11 TRINITY_DN23778_c0_g1_i1:129-617(+)
MAQVSGARSKLNPDAPLFIPAAFRQVEDFSPEWWELVKTSTWFHDYWLQQHQEQEWVDDNDDDIADLLPDSFDLGITEEYPDFMMHLEDEAPSSKTKETALELNKEKPLSGLETDAEMLIKKLSLKSPKGGGVVRPEAPKYREKPAQCVSPKCSPRRIQQPR